jgi:hypothetical protein
MLVGGFDFFSISRLELTRIVLIRHITLACDESTNHRPNVSRIWALRCRRQTPIESEKKVSIKEILSDCPAKDGLHCFNRIWDWWNHQLWHFYAFLGSETLLSWGSPVWILRVIPFCWLVLEICAKWTRFFFCADTRVCASLESLWQVFWIQENSRCQGVTGDPVPRPRLELDVELKALSQRLDEARCLQLAAEKESRWYVAVGEHDIKWWSISGFRMF